MATNHSDRKRAGGGTQLADLSAGYVNASDLTLVFDGTVTIPNGENVITFSFAQPYLYLGGNLLLLVQRERLADAGLRAQERPAAAHLALR